MFFQILKKENMWTLNFVLLLKRNDLNMIVKRSSGKQHEIMKSVNPKIFFLNELFIYNYWINKIVSYTWKSYNIL